VFINQLAQLDCGKTRLQGYRHGISEHRERRRKFGHPSINKLVKKPVLTLIFQN